MVLCRSESQAKEARAEVERLTRELNAAKARLKGGTISTASPAAARWKQPNREAIREWARSQGIPVNRPGFGGGSLVEFQATRLVRSPASYSASNSVGGLPPQAP